jgi:hypothetical protein
MTTKQTSLKRAFGAAALLTAALTLAGCGGSDSNSPAARSTTIKPISESAYSTKLQQIGAILVPALNSLGQKSSDFKRIETHVGTGQAALRRAAGYLAVITPPAAARADNRTLATGMRAFAAQLTQLRKAAARRNLKAVIAADDAIDRSPAIKAMMAAAADLQHKGYKLGQLAPSNKG